MIKQINKIKVMNLISEEYQIFMNGYDLETNLISSIIFKTKNKAKILDNNYRDKITKEAKLQYIKSINGQKKVYSPVFDMIAYY